MSSALIINNGSKSIEKIQNLLSANGISSDHKHYSTMERNDLDSYDFYILSGGKDYPVLGNQYIDLERELLRTSTKPILGICFGFEALVDTYGGTLERRADKVTDVIQITIEEPDHGLFYNIPSLKVKESHYWVAPNLPAKLKALASSEFGVEIVQVEGTRIFGFQFHPELLTEETTGDELFRNWLKY